MADYGFKWLPARAGMFVPFDDGTSIQLWDDDARCEQEIRRPGAGGPEGLASLLRREAAAARRSAAGRATATSGSVEPHPATSSSAGSAATARLGSCSSSGRWSSTSSITCSDERLQSAYLGQGVIGTFASPHDPGTASIHFHHQSGRLGGTPGMWGYVVGGMGMVSFILCDIARDAGAVVLTGVPGRPDHPGHRASSSRGESGSSRACVVSNADPRVTLRLLGNDADPAWRARVEAIPQVGCTVKLNVVLKELPSFTARPGTQHASSSRPDQHAADQGGVANEPIRRPAPANCPSGSGPSSIFRPPTIPASHPQGVHTMSVFAQYVPHTFARGDWDSRRDDVKELALRSIARYCDNIPEAVLDVQVLGPPDIEREVGLTGGHIFQGECLPAYMWDKRLQPRTPMPGVFLCGAVHAPRRQRDRRSMVATPPWRSWRGNRSGLRERPRTGGTQASSIKRPCENTRATASTPPRDRPPAPTRAASGHG